MREQLITGGRGCEAKGSREHAKGFDNTKHILNNNNNNRPGGVECSPPGHKEQETMKRGGYMKRVLRTCLAAAAIMAGPTACVNHESTPDDSGLPGAIAFGVSPSSRAVIDDATQIGAFHVWAYHYGEGNTDVTDVFDSGEEETVFDVQEVTKVDNRWVYEPLRMWEKGVTYNFYALYPTDEKHEGLVPTAEGTLPYLSIAMHDASFGSGSKETMIDLMMGVAKGLKYDETAGAQPVELAFHHLLAQLRFVGKRHAATEGIAEETFKPVVISMKLYGMYTEGSFSSEHFDEGDVTSIRGGWKTPSMEQEDETTANNPYAEHEGTVELSMEGNVLMEAITVIPQRLEPNFYLDIAYSTDGGTTVRHQQVQLISLLLTTWEAGQVYTYTFTVSDDERILFDTPTVNAWEEAAGGIIIVE